MSFDIWYKKKIEFVAVLIIKYASVLITLNKYVPKWLNHNNISSINGKYYITIYKLFII